MQAPTGLRRTPSDESLKERPVKLLPPPVPEIAQVSPEILNAILRFAEALNPAPSAENEVLSTLHVLLHVVCVEQMKSEVLVVQPPKEK